ncbi:helix-turn-helix transcriptional regulator [Streptomyces sp. RFCAC02]|uniref:helix-turn-helix domain-containing protein n=1 Tax=Streptomyces sp. RFCAC02 TaxID=2499143 RepID=UPI0010223CA1|nr:helix-turn-helix transcriptional regulator [Streptomyces sp. RFCAC02]
MAVVSSSGPLAARRKLGGALRKLRDAHAMTAEEVGGHLDCHLSKISRIELGKRACSKRDFEALMDLFGVAPEQRSELHELMIRGRQRVAPWWHAHGDVVSVSYGEFMTYEAEAVTSLEYQPLFIPGLLQTESYARAVTATGFAALGPDQVDSLVEVRMTRQERLREATPLELGVLVNEAALRMQVGGVATMRGQLRALKDACALPHVEFRVIPFSAGETGAACGAFILFGMGDGTDSDVAFMETAGGNRFRDDALTVRRLNRLHRNLRSAALTQEESLERIEQVEKEMI